jgi:hypothetical protein
MSRLEQAGNEMLFEALLNMPEKERGASGCA